MLGRRINTRKRVLQRKGNYEKGTRPPKSHHDGNREIPTEAKSRQRGVERGRHGERSNTALERERRGGKREINGGWKGRRKEAQNKRKKNRRRKGEETMGEEKAGRDRRRKEGGERRREERGRRKRKEREMVNGRETRRSAGGKGRGRGGREKEKRARERERPRGEERDVAQRKSKHRK